MAESLWLAFPTIVSCEVQTRHIVILEDPAFLERLYELAETFENPELQEAIRKVEAALSG